MASEEVEAERMRIARLVMDIRRDVKNNFWRWVLKRFIVDIVYSDEPNPPNFEDLDTQDLEVLLDPD